MVKLGINMRRRLKATSLVVIAICTNAALVLSAGLWVLGQLA
jgi:putative intracellular protease/amidase